MKKILLLVAVASLAASASAQVFPAAAEMDGVDITPKGYIFHESNGEFVGYTSTDVLPWNMNVNWYRDNYVAQNKEIGDGLVVVTGGQVYNKAENVEVLGQATKIIDLGGTCGKVFCLNFAGSTFPAKYKELTGKDLEIGEAVAGAQPLLFWHFNHTDILNYVGQARNGEDYMPMRVRMVVNIYANKQNQKGQYWKCYMNDDQNNVRPANKEDNVAPDILVDPAEFAYRWCEKSTDPEDAMDDGVWTKGANGKDGEWNPNRWLVYEWDVNAADRETEDELFKGNIRLKNEIPGGSNHGEFTVLIREIRLYVPENENREYIYAKRPRTWLTYTTGESDGIADVIADQNAPVEYFNLQGIRVANPENGMYIMRQGNKVSKVVK